MVSQRSNKEKEKLIKGNYSKNKKKVNDSDRSSIYSKNEESSKEDNERVYNEKTYKYEKVNRKKDEYNIDIIKKVLYYLLDFPRPRKGW